MTPEAVVDIMQEILARPLRPELGDQKANAIEKLILGTTAFLSLDDPDLRNAILSEATNRLTVAYVSGKKPWELR